MSLVSLVGYFVLVVPSVIVAAIAQIACLLQDPALEVERQHEDDAILLLFVDCLGLCQNACPAERQHEIDANL